MPSKIEWCDEVLNCITGCTPISAGCKNCYAERMAKRLQAMGQANYKNGFRVTCHPHVIEKPFRWKKPRRIFVCSMGDLFHEDVPLQFVAAVFGAMAANPRHTFQVLTKRPERMVEFFSYLRLEEKEDPSLECAFQLIEAERMNSQQSNFLPIAEKWGPNPDAEWPLPNVWIGVTAENQETADERIPILMQIPAAVRFVSCEPMLGRLDLNRWLGESCCGNGTPYDGYNPPECCGNTLPPVDWVIAGGESGPNARPMDPDWARELRDQCKAAGVPFMFKQWGEWRDCCRPSEWEGEDPRNYKVGYFDDKPYVRLGKKRAGRLLDGKEWQEFPNG